MEVLGVVERAAGSHLAVLPFLELGLIASALWAYRRKRYGFMTATVLMSAGSVLLFSNGLSARASAREAPEGATLMAAPPAGGGGPPPAGADLSNYSSMSRLHPRFPDDFPLPATFIHEHSSGGLRHGMLTVRFRFRGEGAEAVQELEDLGRRSGWAVEVKAPHRAVFRKGGREVEAWFSFPGHSLVLDIPDPR